MNLSVFTMLGALCFGLFFTMSLGDPDWCFTNGGIEPYNKENQACCGGKISDLLSNQKCCGDVIIDKGDTLCCKGKPQPRFTDTSKDGERREQRCCGSQLISGDSTGCCFESPVYLTEEQTKNAQDLECCSEGVLADLRTEKCCGGQAINSHNMECCAGEPLDTGSFWCANILNREFKLRLDQHYCHDTVYTITEKSCCSDVLNHTTPWIIDGNSNKVNPNYDCCETKVMHPTNEKCCHSGEYEAHAIPNKSDFECCGDGYYDKSFQTCVDGQAVSLRLGQKKCGNHTYDTSKEGCCRDHLPYNIASEQCCPGLLSSVIPRNQKCCNGKGMNENQLCCGQTKPITKDHVNDDDCCYNELTGEGQTFNSKAKTQKCYNGKVFNVFPEMEVCGNEQFNPDKFFCCKGDGDFEFKLVDKASGNNECCGTTPFNNHSQTCCYGRVFEIPTEKALCCPFNYKAYTWHNISSPCTRVCPGSGSYFDTHDEECCDGVVYRYKNGYSCCGPLYHRTNGRRNHRKPFDCCNNKDVYSKRTSVCLDGEVRPKEKGLTDTQGVCNRALWRSVDGVIRHSCTSQHVLVGKLKERRIRRRAYPDTTIVELVMIRIKAVWYGLHMTPWKGPKRLTFEVHVPKYRPTGSSIDCAWDFEKTGKRAVVFFSAPVEDGRVTINTQDSFRIVKDRVLRSLKFRKLRKKGINKSFCEQKYPDFLKRS